MRTNKTQKTLYILSASVLLVMLAAACSPAPAEVPVTGAEMPAMEAEVSTASEVMQEQMPAEPDTASESTVGEEPAAMPVLMAAEPLQSDRNLQDTDGSLRAYEKRAVDGDNILNNLYERSFTSQAMDYLPDINIISTEIGFDDAFFYFTILLDDVDMDTNSLTGTYGIEFDRTRTGRGDLLVLAKNVQSAWSTEGVSAYTDENGDVGGAKPILAEEGFSGNGYETMLTFEGDRVAQARLHPELPNAVQIAISKALLEDAEEFLWGAWADKVVIDPAKFDYNDAYRRAEAGSPIKGDFYPLQALHSLDNTCRLPFGFASAGGIPGMCLSIPKPEKREPGKACEQVCVNFGNQTVCYCV